MSAAANAVTGRNDGSNPNRVVEFKDDYVVKCLPTNEEANTGPYHER